MSNFFLEYKNSSKQIDTKNIIEILIYLFIVIFNSIIFEFLNININKAINIV